MDDAHSARGGLGVGLVLPSARASRDRARGTGPRLPEPGRPWTARDSQGGLSPFRGWGAGDSENWSLLTRGNSLLGGDPRPGALSKRGRFGAGRRGCHGALWKLRRLGVQSGRRRGSPGDRQPDPRARSRQPILDARSRPHGPSHHRGGQKPAAGGRVAAFGGGAGIDGRPAHRALSRRDFCVFFGCARLDLHGGGAPRSANRGSGAPRANRAGRAGAALRGRGAGDFVRGLRRRNHDPASQRCSRRLGGAASRTVDVAA